MEYIHRSNVEEKGVFPLKDYSKVHPLLKQQYTYQDLEAAFNAALALDFGGKKFEYDTFEEWFKGYKFEMV